MIDIIYQYLLDNHNYGCQPIKGLLITFLAFMHWDILSERVTSISTN